MICLSVQDLTGSFVVQSDLIYLLMLVLFFRHRPKAVKRHLWKCLFVFRFFSYVSSPIHCSLYPFSTWDSPMYKPKEHYSWDSKIKPIKVQNQQKMALESYKQILEPTKTSPASPRGFPWRTSSPAIFMTFASDVSDHFVRDMKRRRKKMLHSFLFWDSALRCALTHVLPLILFALKMLFLGGGDLYAMTTVASWIKKGWKEVEKRGKSFNNLEHETILTGGWKVHWSVHSFLLLLRVQLLWRNLLMGIEWKKEKPLRVSS